MSDNNLEDLFAHNRAWSAQMERDRPGFFTSLIKQQTPRYMWIGCSDSRVPANQITGLEPGEVFVHRNVANIVVHSDLNALSAIQYAVEHLKVEHIMVVGHYGCGGVKAALSGTRIGLADNWIRHIQDVRDRHHALLESLPEEARVDALCDLNVAEQVVNVAVSTVMVDAWSRGQKVNIHGWIFGVHDGLLQDLGLNVDGAKPLDTVYKAAVQRIRYKWSKPGEVTQQSKPQAAQQLEAPAADGKADPAA
ncbi:carbonate dehydratase [Variovorax sp. ZS18.2.2]|uniref:carbonate dehydratase n=1 Tax=Variovorax sp. ZS18.2.2 TaxID=2971255 RepID=UPI0021519907|nr:carbonate dehydratase [Variovorax sp. ZS18.2.2]MCR6480809.1 carbonate dehydratase [Variovorax sp. ZS18.2.2]